MQQGLSPSLSQAFVAWTAFWLQDPAPEASSMYLSSFSFSRGSSRNR
uniref:SYM n=1 Tax=Arundo donax TaxID=35708 RepID=A0A0A9C0T6_ARUDO